MNRNKMRNQLISLCLAVAIVTLPLGELFGMNSACVYAVENATGGASVTFGTNMNNNKAEAVISTVKTDSNYAVITTHGGRECIETQIYFTSAGRSAGLATIPIRVDDSYISATDRNIAVTVTYFDHGFDPISVNYKNSSGGTRSILFSKYGSNTWRTATVLLQSPSFNGTGAYESDLWISANETALVSSTEYISKVAIVNLDKTYGDGLSFLKADVLHEYEANGLYRLGLLEGYSQSIDGFGLDALLTKEAAVKAVITAAYGGSQELLAATCQVSDVSEAAKPYVGLALSKGIVSLNADGTLGAGESITLGELLNMFILAIENEGYRDLGTTTYELARTLGLLNNVFDVYEYGSTGSRIFTHIPGFMEKEATSLNRYAYLDDLAGIVYNAMKTTVAGNAEPMLAMLHERGVINRDMLSSSGCGQLLLTFYRQTGFTIVEDSFIDETTGVMVHTMSLPGLRTASGYSHSCGATADGKIFVLATGIDATDSGHLVTYNRETKETKLIHPEGKKSGAYMYMLCTQTNEVVYTCQRELYVYDIDTGVNRHVMTQDATMAEVWTGVPSITADGELVALFGCDATTRKPMSIDTVNLRTGQLTRTLTKEDVLALPSDSPRWEISHINHVNINPVYKNLYYYVRENKKAEGITTDPPYEVWVYNSDTEEHHLIYRDHINETTFIKDASTSHYVWSLDGEKNYFISYWSNDYIEQLPGQGIVGVTKEGSVDSNGKKDGRITSYINGDYAYNHVGVGGGDDYFVGDLSTVWSEDRNRYEGKVILVNGETKKSRLLVDKMAIESAHPGHTHPLLSRDNSTVYFTMADDNYRLMAAYIDLTSLPAENPEDYLIASVEIGATGITENGIARYTEYRDRRYYSPLITNYGFIGGESCLEIPKGHNNPFDVYPNYISYADNVVTMEIEYFDNGTDPITIEYNSNNLNAATANARDRKPYSFNRTNSATWKTHTFTITDASFRNALDNFSDFRINAASSTTPIYIKSIRAAKGTTIPEISVDTEAPAAPTGLVATNITTSTVDLSWTASDAQDIAYYKVYRGGEVIAQLTETNYTSIGLSDGTTYAYTVTAVDANGNESESSVSVSATTEAIIRMDMSGVTDNGTSTYRPTKTTADGMLSMKGVDTRAISIVSGGLPAAPTTNSVSFANYTDPETGVTTPCFTSYNLTANYGLQFNFDSTYLNTADANTVTFFVKYLDNFASNQYIQIGYVKVGGGNNPVMQTTAIRGGNTGEWKEAQVTYTDVRSDKNPDFCIRPYGIQGVVYISEVGVAKNYVAQ